MPNEANTDMHTFAQLLTRQSASRLIVSTAVLAFLLSPKLILGQAGNASISGRVSDSSGAVIRNTGITLKNLATGITMETSTNNEGLYRLSSLNPGGYVLLVQKKGFQSVSITGVSIYTDDELNRNITLIVGSISESVTVSGGLTNVSPAVSMTVSREFIDDMPLNGRSFQDLIQLVPGVVSDTGGYYSVSGQRTDSNNYTVDGVSANLGGFNNDTNNSIGAGLAGASPAQTALGTTQSLASVDSLQEFKIQTSGYTAEYGRNPGGQVQITTRSGTNDVHGTLFDYLRNTALDANSYQNDYYGYPKTAEHQNDFGGTVSGPLTIPKLYNGKDKTFYFFSYEGLRLLLPDFEDEYVPTPAFRDWASPNIQPVLNAAPLPNPSSQGNQDGCTIPDPSTGSPTACDALFTYGFSDPEQVDSISARLDQNFGKRFHAFIRYADTPSSHNSGAEQVEAFTTTTRSWTAGLTANISSTLLNELRFNSTGDREFTSFSQRPINGSVPLPRTFVIPSQYDTPAAYGRFTLEVPDSSLEVTPQYISEGTHLRQYQVIDSISRTKGNHTLKFGADWRRIASSYTVQTYRSSLETLSLNDIQNGDATSVAISANNPGQPIFHNLSLYAQDHWQIGSKLSVDYGLRWEFNPPPGPSNGAYPAVLTSNNLATATLAPVGTPPYQTTYNHFAPRFGFAWNAISSRRPVTVRGGVGVFYDTGQATIGNAYANAYPFSASRPTQREVPLPLPNAIAAPPTLNYPLVAPYPYGLYPTDPDLTLPYTEQWNLSIDYASSAHNVITASYVGNNGRKLLYTAGYSSAPNGNINFPQGLQFTNNGSQSSYNAVQMQDTGRIAPGLDVVGSFTWAHALDNASSDDSGFSPIWGNSTDDLRRVLNLALNYKLSAGRSSGWLQALRSGWLLSNRFSAQSGYPLIITQSDVVLPDGTNVVYGPDLVPHVRIYLHGRDADINGEPVPGSWRLNPDAFTPVPTDPATGNPVRPGTLGRNYVRTPSFWALNTAIQRDLPIDERVHLSLRVDAFNIFNHPNYGNPDSYFPGSNFGQLSSYITTIGSSNSLYAMGAARSLQLSLKLQF